MRLSGYTKYGIWCHSLFGITQRYNCLLCIMFFFLKKTNKSQIGCLDMLKHRHLYLVKTITYE